MSKMRKEDYEKVREVTAQAFDEAFYLWADNVIPIYSNDPVLQTMVSQVASALDAINEYCTEMIEAE